MVGANCWTSHFGQEDGIIFFHSIDIHSIYRVGQAGWGIRGSMHILTNRRLEPHNRTRQKPPLLMEGWYCSIPDRSLPTQPLQQLQLPRLSLAEVRAASIQEHTELPVIVKFKINYIPTIPDIYTVAIKMGKKVKK